MGMPASFQQPPSLSGWMLLHGGAVLFPATSVLQLFQFGLHVRVSPDSYEMPINLCQSFTSLMCLWRSCIYPATYEASDPNLSDWVNKMSIKVSIKSKSIKMQEACLFSTSNFHSSIWATCCSHCNTKGIFCIISWQPAVEQTYCITPWPLRRPLSFYMCTTPQKCVKVYILWRKCAQVIMVIEPVHWNQVPIWGLNVMVSKGCFSTCT